MGSEPSSMPPSLCYDAFPSQRSEPSGMTTPPLQSPASVPFLWEEAPGKPRKSDDSGPDPSPSPSTKPRSIRPLVLPPKLVAQSSSSSSENAKVAVSIPSPTTVLDGPYNAVGLSPSIFDGPTVVGRAAFSSFTFGDRCLSSDGKKKETLVWFWRKLVVRRRVGSPASPPLTVTFPTSTKSSTESSYYCKEPGHDGEGDGGDINKVHITRLRRSSSLLNVSSSTTHLWASIHGGLKQVVPWRAKKVNKAAHMT